MASEPNRPAPSQASSAGAALSLLPIGATFGYYALPASLKEQLLLQFVPQFLAYVGLSFWAVRVSQVPAQLGLERGKVRSGLQWGVLTGLLLGVLNTFVILVAYPFLGYDITFLKQTPHGRLPVLLMVPWLICGIALFVELNFRGFLLGRLAELESHWRDSNSSRRLSPLALTASTLTFAFDPFMVNTFQYLHWIALWDGLIWGSIWLRTRNLWITIMAHAVEVIVMYSAVKAAIG
ncbi:MAG: CPBP family intramembrane metalloprotease [Nitrospira sp.]|nr:CPBP family intramembrane metalloprotease [Nitrospira sp.]